MTTATAVRQSSVLVRAGVAAAFATGIALLAKVTIILATANNAPSVLEVGLYVIGIFAPLLAAAGIASWLGGGWLRKIGTYLGVIALHVFFITMLSDGVGELAKVFSDADYVADEAPLAVLGLIWLIVAMVLRRRVAEHGVQA